MAPPSLKRDAAKASCRSAELIDRCPSVMVPRSVRASRPCKQTDRPRGGLVRQSLWRAEERPALLVGRACIGRAPDGRRWSCSQAESAIVRPSVVSCTVDARADWQSAGENLLWWVRFWSEGEIRGGRKGDTEKHIEGETEREIEKREWEKEEKGKSFCKSNELVKFFCLNNRIRVLRIIRQRFPRFLDFTQQLTY